MIRTHLLSRLYYDLGKQGTNFALQHSHKEAEDVVWTKRRSFLDIDPDADKWFINNCNHRQILKNEIILDFDRPIAIADALQDDDIKRIVERLQREEFRFIVYHTGSKGVHIHIYFDGLLGLQPTDREAFRIAMVKNLRTGLVQGLDLQKCYDNSMIALEHTPHWKTGVMKTVLLNHGVTVWN